MNEKAQKHDQKRLIISARKRLEALPIEVEMIENPIQHIIRSAFCFQAEPDAGKGDEVEGDQDFPEMNDPPGTFFIRRNLFPVIVDHQSQSVHCSPDNEILRSTVPQSTQNHGDQQVQIAVHKHFHFRTDQDCDSV
ncbi:hypothetical protein D3C80_1308450 [compost metagenome]